MAVANYRPFKIPKEVTKASFNPIKKEDLEEFMLADLQASGLEPSDMMCHTHNLSVPAGAQFAYIIPYFDLKGQPIVTEGNELAMFRRRIQWPPFSKRKKYDQPSAEQLHSHNLPGFLPYIPPQIRTFDFDGTLTICEGEKKTASVVRNLGIPAIGIGGMQMWVHPDGSKRIHPWISEILESKDIKTVEIIPDGDLWKYDICKSYGDFSNALVKAGYEVKILNPPDKIDDLIVQWGPECKACYEALPHIESKELVQSRASLCLEYDLATEYVSKNKPAEVQQHTANIMRLIELHPAFPKIWTNLDTGHTVIGDTNAVADVTEMHIANHFQHNFQFHKTNHKVVRDCVKALAGQNSNSPMLEWVKEQVWDGKPRLETWLIDYWGCEPTEWAKQVGLKFLVSSVARMVRPGCKVDWMFVTVGGQKLGKTSMASVLFRGHDIMIVGKYDSKDFKMLLHSGLCMVVDELDSFGKAETSFWKATISATEDTYRPPYTAMNVTNPRRCVIYGTANRHEFLTLDPSGYRRYAPVIVDKLLDFQSLQTDLGQLWAEAYHHYKEGGIDYGNIQGWEEVVDQFVAPSMYDELVTDFLHTLDKKNVDCKHGEYVNFKMSRVLEFIGMERQINNTALTKEVAAILRGYGCERGRYRLHGSDYPVKAWRFKLSDSS